MTSEPQSLASEAEEAWGIGFASIGDPHHEIRDICQKRGIVNVFSNPDFGHLDSRPWASHLKGYFQPAVVAIASNSRVLYRWRCRPTRKNMSGAGQRPTAEYVWSQVENQRVQGTKDVELDESPEFALTDVSWFTFLSIMLAHGWFIRPKAFPLARKGDKRSARPSRMRRRIALFVAAWAVAFVLFPVGWVVSSLVLWGALVWPGIATVNRQFQNISEAEPPLRS